MMLRSSTTAAKKKLEGKDTFISTEKNSKSTCKNKDPVPKTPVRQNFNDERSAKISTYISVTSKISKKTTTSSRSSDQNSNSKISTGSLVSPSYKDIASIHIKSPPRVQQTIPS